MKDAIYNPKNADAASLPVIYGFNNGGSPGWFMGCLLAEDGTFLGSHVCSHEGFMPGDLGILEGHRDDRHKTFREHYPDGYRMEFVGHASVEAHAGLSQAISSANAKKEPTA